MRVIFFLPILFLAIACNNSNSSGNATSHDSTKTVVVKTERESPANYLISEGNYRKNVAGRWVVEGTITNKATHTFYKDVVLKVFYYDKANKEIGSELLTVNDYFKPGSTKEFKVKSYGTYGAKSVGYKIVSAKVMD